MQVKKLSILLFVIGLLLSGCQKRVSIEGVWKPYKVKIWDNYFQEFLLIDLDSKSLRYSDDAMDRRFTSPRYTDSIIANMLKSYLALDERGRFKMNDYAFFTQTISDYDWQGMKSGTWENKAALLTLTQSNNLNKCFKIVDLSKTTLIIGELFQCSGRPITEIFLRR